MHLYACNTLNSRTATDRTTSQFYDALGRARTSPEATSIDLGTGMTAKSLSLGGEHTCAILNDDSIKCWGAGHYGQLGYGDASSRTSPEATSIDLGTGMTAKAISLGQHHTCATLNDDSIKCFGKNNLGQLGYGDTAQ